jgi:hypothetical protein
MTSQGMYSSIVVGGSWNKVFVPYRRALPVCLPCSGSQQHSFRSSNTVPYFNIRIVRYSRVRKSVFPQSVILYYMTENCCIYGSRQHTYGDISHSMSAHSFPGRNDTNVICLALLQSRIICYFCNPSSLTIPLLHHAIFSKLNHAHKLIFYVPTGNMKSQFRLLVTKWEYRPRWTARLSSTGSMMSLLAKKASFVFRRTMSNPPG